MNRKLHAVGYFLIFIPFVISINICCNKAVEIPNPINNVTALQVFSSDATATAAMMGIYSYMANNSSFSSFETTYYLGLSADELIDEPSGFENYDLFLSNNLNALQSSTAVSSGFWQPAYFDIYSANAVISGVQSSSGISLNVKNELLGEAKFIRAFCYFYLTNIFGDLPLVLTTDFNQSDLLPMTSQSRIYSQIIADLQDAQSLMITDFSLSDGMPIRPNRWAATAMLARVYQYLGLWKSADSAATAVIGSGYFNLVANLDSVFLASSPEAIFQLQTASVFPYATLEGHFFVPFDSTSSANCWLTSDLLASFEPNDYRRENWVDSTDYSGTFYYYPSKYKIGTGTAGNSILENYTLLRFAEQFLIRAEAEANLNQYLSAISDLNVIRSRAGLANLPTSLNYGQLMAAIQQEYRIEFFGEWGHRWLDLRRWGIAIQTLDTIGYKTPNIDSSQLLYPVPITEIQTDPNLSQNVGY